MKPTLQQVLQWVLERKNNPSEESMHEHIAQRAAEWASAQSAECIAELERQRGKLLEALDGMLADVHSLMAESEGVAGLHLNGDIATWCELDEGGRFERLSHISESQAAIAEVRGEK